MHWYQVQMIYNAYNATSGGGKVLRFDPPQKIEI